MNSQNNLDSKQKSIVKISALTAVGNLKQLTIELDEALNSGLSINEIKEILVQMYAYCGFPRSLNAINTLMAVLEERKTKGITDVLGKDASPISDVEKKYEIGKKNLQRLTNREETDPKTGASAFAPIIDTFLKEHLFADIFSRDVLTFQQRELATISALSTMKGAEPQLQAHIFMGKNTGLIENQLEQAFLLIGKITKK